MSKSGTITITSIVKTRSSSDDRKHLMIELRPWTRYLLI